MDRILACWTTEKMIIDEPGRLEMGVTNRRTEEFEPTTFHVLADCIRKFCTRRNLLNRFPTVDDGLSLWQEVAEIRTKTAEFLLNSKKTPSIGNCGIDFQPIKSLLFCTECRFNGRSNVKPFDGQVGKCYDGNGGTEHPLECSRIEKQRRIVYLQCGNVSMTVAE